MSTYRDFECVICGVVCVRSPSEADICSRCREKYKVDLLEDKIEKLQKENAELREALEFYADNNNWIGCGKNKELRINNDSWWMDVISGNGFEIEYDKEVGGKLARQTLTRLSEKEK